MKVVIYTALYGAHSSLKEFDACGYDCICYSDSAHQSRTWKVVQTHSITSNPRKRSKEPKMLNPLAEDYDVTIWIDSTITLTNTRRFVAECLASLEGCEIVLFKHPERDGIVEEASVSEMMPKYAGQKIVEQAMGYAREGMPLGTLYAGGVIARSAPLLDFGVAWLGEMSKSLQDQVSLPYALWKHGIVPGVIPGSVYGTDYHLHHWEGPDR